MESQDTIKHVEVTEEVKKSGSGKLLISILLIMISIFFSVLNALLSNPKSGNYFEDIGYMMGIFSGSFLLSIIIALIIYFTSKKKVPFLFMFAILASSFSLGNTFWGIGQTGHENIRFKEVVADKITLKVPDTWIRVKNQLKLNLNMESNNYQTGITVAKIISKNSSEHKELDWAYQGIKEQMSNNKNISDITEATHQKINNCSAIKFQFLLKNETKKFELIMTSVIIEGKTDIYLMNLWVDKKYNNKANNELLLKVCNSFMIEE